MAKLQRYKATLSEVEKRRNLVKRRREHLQEEKGSGFWQGLNDVFQATLSTSDAHGYPSQGYDFFNKRPTPKPKDTRKWFTTMRYSVQTDQPEKN